MKHIKTYKVFENQDNSELIKELKRFGIKNYTINSDGTIDVDGEVYLNCKVLSKIPFKFGKVTGHFDIGSNKLTSLEGSPREVGGHFNCAHNKISNLIGGPQEVDGDYYCYGNQLESLEGCAGDIGGYLDCRNNKLEMLDCSSVINGNIYCGNNGFKEEPEFFGICDKVIWR